MPLFVNYKYSSLSLLLLHLTIKILKAQIPMLKVFDVVFNILLNNGKNDSSRMYLFCYYDSFRINSFNAVVSYS